MYELAVELDKKTYSFSLDDSKESLEVIRNWKEYTETYDFGKLINVIIAVDTLRTKIEKPVEITHTICTVARTYELAQDPPNYMKLFSIANSVTSIIVRTGTVGFKFERAWYELVHKYGILATPAIEQTSAEELAQLNLVIVKIKR